ncbi:biopolymer transporter ExbD [Breoghania sp.]|uniref:ExbD/TolR family protein n=1 Tax=Breoghania sp. TaxID=2065378 RepID=UPI0029CA39F5|nr:biopolymer transporter ExbD [Breoghania sp.]
MIELKRKDRQAGIPDVTPILDVVFILLIFFVIAAAFTTHGVEMNLPNSKQARTFAGRSLEVVLSADGQLMADTEAVDLRELGFKVRLAKETPGGMQIVLKADKNASVGMFLSAIGTIRDNGGDHLVIATRPAQAAAILPEMQP